MASLGVEALVWKPRVWKALGQEIEVAMKHCFTEAAMALE
jgi:hypothetical protein